MGLAVKVGIECSKMERKPTRLGLQLILMRFRGCNIYRNCHQEILLAQTEVVVGSIF